MNRSWLGVGMAVFAVAVFAAAGCGSVDDRAAAASDVAVGLARAVGGQDAAAACAARSDAVAAIEQSGAKPCAAAILDKDLPTSDVPAGAEVYGQPHPARLAIRPAGRRLHGDRVDQPPSARLSQSKPVGMAHTAIGISG